MGSNPAQERLLIFFTIGAWESTEHTVLTNLRREGQEIPNLNSLTLCYLVIECMTSYFFHFPCANEMVGKR